MKECRWRSLFQHFYIHIPHFSLLISHFSLKNTIFGGFAAVLCFDDHDEHFVADALQGVEVAGDIGLGGREGVDGLAGIADHVELLDGLLALDARCRRPVNSLLRRRRSRWCLAHHVRLSDGEVDVEVGVLCLSCHSGKK